MSDSYSKDKFNNIFNELEQKATLLSDWNRVDTIRDLRYCIERQVLDAYEQDVKEDQVDKEDLEDENYFLQQQVNDLEHKVTELEHDLEDAQQTIWDLQEKLDERD
jgi:chromosome segregation ATPase